MINFLNLEDNFYISEHASKRTLRLSVLRNKNFQTANILPFLIQILKIWHQFEISFELIDNFFLQNIKLMQKCINLLPTTFLRNQLSLNFYQLYVIVICSFISVKLRQLF